MDKNKANYKLVGRTCVILSLLILVYAIYQYKLGGVTKNLSIYIAAVGLLPALSFVVFYSLKTGETFAKGQKVTKKNNSELYYLNTIFWCFLLFIDFVYVFFKTLGKLF